MLNGYLAAGGQQVQPNGAALGSSADAIFAGHEAKRSGQSTSQNNSEGTTNSKSQGQALRSFNCNRYNLLIQNNFNKTQYFKRIKYIFGLQK